MTCNYHVYTIDMSCGKYLFQMITSRLTNVMQININLEKNVETTTKLHPKQGRGQAIMLLSNILTM